MHYISSYTLAAAAAAASLVPENRGRRDLCAGGACHGLAEDALASKVLSYRARGRAALSMRARNIEMFPNFPFLKTLCALIYGFSGSIRGDGFFSVENFEKSSSEIISLVMRRSGRSV